MINHDKYFTPDAKLRKFPYLIELRANDRGDRPPISLGGGLPCPSTFPLTEATFTLRNGQVLRLSQAHMAEALQYSEPIGRPRLLSHLRELAAKVHNPPHMDERGLFITGGANSSIYLILHTFLSAGDYIITEEYTYPNLLNSVKDVKANVVAVPSDSQGIRVNLLREALSKLPAGRRKLIYFTPNGGNPTGNTMSESRRREVYDLVCKYDLLLCEDDPYFILQYSQQQRPPSFLGLDTEGRVLRIDSFAKTLGAGLRLGYITADKPFIERLVTMNTFIITHGNTLGQVILEELFHQWGIEWFLKFTNDIKGEYKKKRDMMLQAANKHLTGLCEWTPSDGMFLWMKVFGLEDTKHIIEHECRQQGLVLVPGSAFMKDHAISSPYVRASFSTATPEEADEGLKILAEIIRAELKKQNKMKEETALSSGRKEAMNGHTHEPKKEVNGSVSETK